MTKDLLVKRASERSERPDDYWENFAGMLQKKPGISITDRRHYSQKEWNWLMQVKSELKRPWE